MTAPEVDEAALAPRERYRIGVPPFLTGRPLVTLFAGALVVAAGGFVLYGPAAWAALFFALLASLAIVSIPARLVVGSDGVAVEWLWRRLFVPYASMTAEHRTIDGLRLEVEGGRSLELKSRRPEHLLVLVRTRRAFAHSVRGMLAEEALASDAALLATAEREDLAGWATRLRTMSDADYRSASLPRDRLLAVVGAPHVAPELRAAAAFVLGPPRSDDEAATMDRARASTASGVLERALLRARGDDEGARLEGLRAVLSASRREAADRRR